MEALFSPNALLGAFFYKCVTWRPYSLQMRYWGPSSTNALHGAFLSPNALHGGLLLLMCYMGPSSLLMRYMEWGKKKSSRKKNLNSPRLELFNNCNANISQHLFQCGRRHVNEALNAEHFSTCTSMWTSSRKWSNKTINWIIHTLIIVGFNAFNILAFWYLKIT